MKKIVLVHLLSIAFICNSFSQQSKIVGQIVDENQQPLSFISAYIVNFSDTSKVQKVSISDLQGEFVLDKVNPGKYILILSSIGYKTQKDTIICPLIDSITKTYTLLQSAENLAEVVVSAKLTQRYADKNIYIVPPSAKKSASSAFDVIKILPKVTVDIVNRKISTVHGENITILINGINADEAELLTINPSDVVKVEHYEMPPARYATNNVGSVINIITKQGIQGGEVFTNFQNAFLTGFGNDQVRIKYNKDNNQFTLGYSASYRNYKQREVNSSYTYLENNNLINKNKIGLKSPFDYIDHNFGLGFINQHQNDYLFSAKLTSSLYSGHTTIGQDILFNNIYYGNNCQSKNDDYSIKPSLDLYFSKNINTNQEFALNIVSTYFNIDYEDRYFEFHNKDTTFQNHTKINGKKYSSIIEGIYSIKFEITQLNLGVKYTYANSANKFLGSVSSENISANTNNSYEYIELVGKLSDLSYQASAGLIYNTFISKQLDKNYNFLSFRPSVDLSYSLSQNSQIKLNGTIEPYTPSLSELSTNLIFEDSLMAYTGNSGLKPYSLYKSALTYSYNLAKINISASLSSLYANSIILPEYIKGNNYFIQTEANQKWQKQYNLNLDIQFSPFEQKWIELELYGEIYETKNKGIHFANDRIDYQYQSTITFNYSNFSLMAFFQNGYNTLMGEILLRNASTSFAQLQYKKKNFTLACGIYYPFEKSWNTTSESYNSPIIQTKYRTDIYDNGHMIFANLVYNFSFGRKFNAEEKKISNQDNDSGILKQSK